MDWVIIALTLSLAFFFYQVLFYLFDKGKFISRIGIYTGQVEIKKDDRTNKKVEPYRQGLGFLSRSIERAGFLNQYKTNLRKKLIKANILMRAEEFLSISILAALISGFLGALFLNNLFFVMPFSLPGWIIPGIMLNKNIAKRLKSINNQLGDTIAILSNAMKAGHSFFQAIDSVSKEMKGPVSEEFTKLQKEISLGVNTETALENMVSRVGSDDLELMVTAVLIQRQIGGNLAEILDNISSTIRLRVRTKGEIRAMTAQGRMSGWIISLLPFGLAAMVSVISPAQMKTLIGDPLGIVMIIFALVMETIGIMIVKKVVNVEV